MQLALEPTFMPEVEIANQGATFWGSVAAGVTAALGGLYAVWSKINVSRESDATESEALKTLRAAVEQWKGIADEAWTQAKKEREMRVAAEQRTQVAIEEVEGLRGEVASLRREIEGLTSMVAAYQKGAT